MPQSTPSFGWWSVMNRPTAWPSAVITHGNHSWLRVTLKKGGGGVSRSTLYSVSLASEWCVHGAHAVHWLHLSEFTNQHVTMCEKSASNLWRLRANVPGVGRGEVGEGLKRRRGTHGTFQSPQRAALTRLALQNGPGPFGALALTWALNFKWKCAAQTECEYTRRAQLNTPHL